MLSALQASIAFAYLFFVPGLPFAFEVARRTKRWRCVLALSPLVSIAGNFLVLTVLNIVGIRPDMTLFAGVMLAGTVGACAVWVRPTRLEVRSCLVQSARVLPAAVAGLVIWYLAYRGFVFLAPNQDAINHNFWIARIIDTGSALTSDVKVGGPLQPLGSGQGFYPMAWHSSVGGAAALSGLSVPVASLFSTIVVWTIGLSAGLDALAGHWAPSVRHLGPLAALLAQVYPLVPGVPMTWGSMTSVVGVAFLPIGVWVTAQAAVHPSRNWMLLGGFVGLGLFFVHSPEAATLLVIAGVQFVTLTPWHHRRRILRKVPLALVVLVPGVLLVRAFVLEDVASLSQLFGAAHPSWPHAIGAFPAMSISTSLDFTWLSLVFVLGLVAVACDDALRWLAWCIAAIFFVYLVSGAGAGPLRHLRQLTAPWYASYERTLWVAVPFAALVSAYLVCEVMSWRPLEGRWGKSIAIGVAGLLLVALLQQQTVASLRQLQSGPERAAMIGALDFDVMTAADDRLTPGQVVLTGSNDGGMYAYMYFGTPVTAGRGVGADGQQSDDIEFVIENLSDVCDSERGVAALRNGEIGAMILARRGVWGEPKWSERQASQLPGFQLERVGDFLMLLVPDPESCR